MICPICGAELEEGMEECPLCGYYLDNSEKTSPEMSPMENIPDEEKNTLEPSEQIQSVKKRGNSKKSIVLIAFAICTFTVAALLFFTSKNNKSDTAKSDVNKSTTDTTDAEKFATEKPAAEPEQDEPKETAATKEDTQPEASIPVETSVPIHVDNYLGYWNIANNTDRELTIQKVTKNTVQFSLWYYRTDSIENVLASLENDTAIFSTNIDGKSIKGTLTFDKDFISVKITHSERSYMPVETMIFTERHEESWQDTESSSPTQYSIRITAPPVNVYEGPGYNYRSVDTISEQGTCTIIEKVEDNDGYFWGKLTSGIGWINLEEATTEKSTDYSESEYILPDSSTRLLTYDDIKHLSKKQLKLARNEIYARHNRKFDDDEIRAYFESQSWYKGKINPKDFSESMLSKIEKKNVKFIKKYEQ